MEDRQGDENVGGWTSGRKTRAVTTMYFSFPLVVREITPHCGTINDLSRSYAAARADEFYIAIN